MKPPKSKIIAMRKLGKAPKDIVEALGVELQTVTYVLRQERLAGTEFPPLRREKTPPAPAEQPTIRIAPSLNAILSAKARAEGRSPSELAAQILQSALLPTEGAHHG